MKNFIILVGIILYAASIFLPWGPAGSSVETGFNEEASPGILGILTIIFGLLFGIKTTKKSYLITLFIGILMILLPLTVISKIMEQTNNDLLAVKFGVYLLITGAIIIIYGALHGRKRISKENSLNS